MIHERESRQRFDCLLENGLASVTSMLWESRPDSSRADCIRNPIDGEGEGEGLCGEAM